MSLLPSKVTAGLTDVEDDAERERIRAALLAYCILDPLAMFKAWREFVRQAG